MTDRRHMGRAVELARTHHTHPNPRVGAVLVDQAGQVVGEGSHHGPGKPHAEVVALAQAGELALGATLYVSLEPCDHHGLTSPCVDALLAAGVARVVAAVEDPDPRTAGRGIARLRESGVEVVSGVMAEEAEAVDPAYFYHRRTGLALVTWKYAATLDGSAAAGDGTSQWISSEAAREDAHRIRAEVDAVVIGAGTLRADDPHLTVRLDDPPHAQPIPVVVAGESRLPTEARLWDRDPVVISAFDRPIPSGALVVVEGREGRPDPVAAVRALADLGHLDLLLEGGPRLSGEWWRAGVIRRGILYLGSKVGGGMGTAPLGGVFSSIEAAEVVSITAVRSLGGDIRVDFER